MQRGGGEREKEGTYDTGERMDNRGRGVMEVSNNDMSDKVRHTLCNVACRLITASVLRHDILPPSLLLFLSFPGNCH